MGASTKQAISNNANSTVHTGPGIVNSSMWEFTMGTLTKQAIIKKNLMGLCIYVWIQQT